MTGWSGGGALDCLMPVFGFCRPPPRGSLAIPEGVWYFGLPGFSFFAASAGLTGPMIPGMGYLPFFFLTAAAAAISTWR